MNNLKELAALPLIVASFVFCSAGCTHLEYKNQKQFVNPFAELAPANRPNESKSDTCPEVPPPVVDVMSQTYYEDSHHSVIDPKRHEQSREMVKPLRTFNNQVARLSDRIWKFNDLKAENCLYNWLDAWAKVGALLGDANYQGEFERKWNLSGIALSYLKIETLVRWTPEQKSSIVKWLEKIAIRVRHDYDQKIERQSRRNNHIYWA